jgi:ABC-type Fe3+ transport system permease subunit
MGMPKSPNSRLPDSPKGWLFGLLMCGGCICLIMAWRLPAPDRREFFNTFALGIGSAAIALPLGLLGAWVCLKRGAIGHALFFCCIATLFVPLFLHVGAWDSAFGKLGWINAGKGQLTPLLSGWSAAIWVHAMAAVPQITLIVWFALRGPGRIYEEQALIDANPGAVFLHVTVRRLVPVLATCLIWVVVSCAREIAVTDIYGIGTLAERIYLGYALDLGISKNIGVLPPENFDLIGGVWITISALIILSVTMVVTATRYVSPWLDASEITPSAGSFGKPTASENAVGVLLLLLVAAAPIANLLARASFCVDLFEGQIVQRYSIEGMWNTLRRVFPDYGAEFQWSCLIAGASSAALMIVAVGASWLSIQHWIWQAIAVTSVGVCCGLPGPLIGSGVVDAFTLVDVPWINYLFDRTILPPVIATFFFCWPVVYLLVSWTIRNTPRDALENARLEGADSAQQLARIALAINWKSLLGCWMISYAVCFGELSASQQTLPPGIDTIPRLMLGLLHSGVNEMTAALTIVNIAVAVSLTALGWWLVDVKRRSSKNYHRIAANSESGDSN